MGTQTLVITLQRLPYLPFVQEAEMWLHTWPHTVLLDYGKVLQTVSHTVHGRGRSGSLVTPCRSARNIHGQQ
jgi:hypothetical protein